jgi:hypothetical protein
MTDYIVKSSLLADIVEDYECYSCKKKINVAWIKYPFEYGGGIEFLIEEDKFILDKYGVKIELIKKNCGDSEMEVVCEHCGKLQGQFYIMDYLSEMECIDPSKINEITLPIRNIVVDDEIYENCYSEEDLIDTIK